MNRVSALAEVTQIKKHSIDAPLHRTQTMNESSQSDPELVALLENLWQRHLPSTHERLDLLDRVVETIAAGPLDEERRAAAQAAAHKLSGNLGMFGYREAGEIAGEMEQILESPTSETIPNLVHFMQRLRALLAEHL
jgi:HPt (histidine-containing phosphotransfer) domain-containing protein